jgi:predicted nucleotidyltransferase component of viral defense system
MFWEEVSRRSIREQVSAETVLREEVQKAVLAHFSLQRFFNAAVFQGGTALRLFYGNLRYSEDIDFVFTTKDTDLFRKIGTRIRNLARFVSEVFPFLEETAVKAQKETGTFKRFTLRLRPRDLGRVLRVNIEFANIPSRDNSLALLHYPPFNPAVRVESPHEILADKVVAVALRPYIKGRDLWDIHYLAADRGLTVNTLLVYQKAADYGSTPADFEKGLAKAVTHVRTEGPVILAQEMKRFLPRPAAALYQSSYPKMAAKVAALLAAVSAGDSRDSER